MTPRRYDSQRGAGLPTRDVSAMVSGYGLRRAFDVTRALIAQAQRAVRGNYLVALNPAAIALLAAVLCTTGTIMACRGSPPIAETGRIH
jgi:hypothetical protein